MSEIMAELATNYQLGIGISSGVMIVAYILISIFAIRKYRKVKGIVSILGMIPIVNIFLLFTRKKKGIEKEEVIEDMF